jgi:4-amino-4-deoxy-L-arabinose transferase-like glycosyltransferase
LFAVFEFVSKLYGAKTGFLSSFFLGIMPGYFWLSHVAMIETMLIFFFTASSLFFFIWLKTDRIRYMLLSGLILGLGVLTKYQAIIAMAAMLTAMVVLSRDRLKKKFTRFPILILTMFLVALPWIILSYQLYTSQMLNTWLYALDLGNPDKSLYVLGLNSLGLHRFPSWYYLLPNWVHTPIFYLLEMTVPYAEVHPISIVLYIIGIAGLGYFFWRRKPEDKYFLIWFLAVYIFFTAIPNKQWRYLVLIFPVLALSTALVFETALKKGKSVLKTRQLVNGKKRYLHISALFLTGIIMIGVAYSVNDTASWIAVDNIYVPVQEATQFVGSNLATNQSIMVVCAQNLFSADMVKFYLRAQGRNNNVYQYPTEPVDTYMPDFNLITFVNLCKASNVKYVLMYEYGAEGPYFNSTLTLMDIYQQLSNSGNFGNLPTLDDLEPNSVSSSTIFGKSPRQIYVITFLG